MKPRKIFLYKRASVDNLKEEIEDAWLKFSNNQQREQPNENNNPPILNAEDACSYFKCTILTALERNVPTKHLTGRWNVPWITPSLRKLIRKKQRSYNLAKKTNDR